MMSSEINVEQNLFLDREGIIQKLTVFNVTTFWELVFFKNWCFVYTGPRLEPAIIHIEAWWNLTRKNLIK